MTFRPKGKLFALLAIFVAIGLVTATAAFTTVEAQRTVTVDTAGDANALLALEGNTTGNGDYVSLSNGEIVIDFSASNLGSLPGAGSAQGVNVNATTNVSHMLNVTNNGPNEVEIWFTAPSTPSGVSIDFYLGDDTGSTLVGDGNAATVASGSQISVGVSLQLEADPGDFDATVTIHAESTA